MSTSSDFTIEQVADLPDAVDDTRAREHRHPDGQYWIYVFGGRVNETGQSDKLARFNPETREVEVHMNFPIANSHPVVGKVGNLFYTIAGTQTSNIYEVDVEAQTITNVADAGGAYADHMGYDLDGQILFWQGAGSDLGAVKKFDPSDYSVTTVNSNPPPIQDGGAVKFDGDLYSIGGNDGNGNYQSDVYRIRNSGSWEKVGDLTLDGSNFTLGRVRPAATSEFIYTVGGRVSQGSGDTGIIDEVYQIDPSTWEMNLIGTLDVIAEDTQVAFSNSNGYLYELGGANSSSAYTDIWEIRSDTFQANRCILLRDDLGLRGQNVAGDERVVMYSETAARTETGERAGDNLILSVPELGQN